jgi:hypothetical protein
MSDRLPELDELGRRLAAARAADAQRRRRRLAPRALLAGVLALGVAVPAVATRSLWAPLSGGETALPAQAPAAVRTTLATGGAPERWRLVAYRARLRGGGIGTCLFLTAGAGGTGVCVAGPRGLVPVVHDAGGATFAAVRVGSVVPRIEARWSDGTRTTARVRTAVLRGGGTVRFAVVARRAGPRSTPAALAAVRPLPGPITP